MNAVNSGELESLGGAVPTRRERLRAATEAEILATARELLVTGGPEQLTLREVGRRMGMTASALYRYVDGHAALMDRLTASFFDELVEALHAEVPDRTDTAAVGLDVVRADLMTASRTFRRWSVAHPHEFRLMFGHHDHFTADCHLAHEAGERFGGVFVRLFAQGLGSPLRSGDGGLFSPLPPPLAELHAHGWIRLLGLVMVEVAGEYEHDYLPVSPDRVFEAEITQCVDTVVEGLRSARSPTAGH